MAACIRAPDFDAKKKLPLPGQLSDAKTGLFMPWLIEAEVADNQNDEPDWADHQRFHGIRF